MSFNDTPRGERVHIALFGRRNAGKSSLINALTGQQISIVSDVAGTTTDPVYKPMELLPIGPVVIIDTPGLDDEGDLGRLRIERAKSVLEKTDIAIITTDIRTGIGDFEREILAQIRERNIPSVVVLNKSDLSDSDQIDSQSNAKTLSAELDTRVVIASGLLGEGILDIKEALIASLPGSNREKRLVGDLLSTGDIVVLVVPIDSAAPKGRLILPQQQVIRDVLESGAISVVTRETELAATLSSLKAKPRIVITDSQAFAFVSKVVPDDVPLTSFSILFARYKGDLPSLIEGAKLLDKLNDGDRILIAEGCTHHRQCDDIGTVKLPRWIEEYTGKHPDFSFTSGGSYPDDLEKYRLIVHCGACMLNEREMAFRIRKAGNHGVPIVNYGVLIAHMKGILSRVIAPFGLE
jgi:[FeFe] hydrogenase H-cluster maturation GTPase HydF